MLTDIAGPQAREARMLLIELCGVFWIVAEMVILFFLLEARRHVARNPIPATPVWDRVATRRAVFFVLFLVGTIMTVVMRPIIWVPLSVRLQNGPLDVNSAALYDFFAAQRHLALWATFVTVWVILETAIVYHGYRAYRIFRSRIPAAGPGPGRPSKPWRARRAALTLLLLCGLAAVGLFELPAFAAQATTTLPSITADSWSQILALSERGLYPYRNAVFLYLRLAGVVWITVEWIAALILWRAYLLVRHALHARRRQS